MSARVTVIGDKAVQIALARTAADLDRPRSALADAAKAVTRAAQRYAAKRTGRMSRSNRTTIGPKVARIVNRTPYATYQEHGTKYMNAHPFMRPAAATDVSEYFEDYADRTLRKNF